VVRRCNSSPDRMPSTVEIEAGETPEWPVIVEAPVARVWPHPEAVEEADSPAVVGAEEADSPAVGEAAAAVAAAEGR